MNMTEHVDMMKAFLAGKLSMPELRNRIDDRLFELRRSPGKTEEEDLLAGVELLICEIEDGFRTSADLEEYIRSLVSSETLVIIWDSMNSPSPIRLGSSNRDAIIVLVNPVQVRMVEDRQIQAAFA
jgi:hypothetical protein